MDIHGLLKCSVQQQASDLHLSAGVPPMLRVDGEMQCMDLPVLAATELEAMLIDLMDESQRVTYAHDHDLDFALEVPDLGRFRVNVFRQNRGIAAVLRTIPDRVPNLDTLGVPAIVQQLCRTRQGLILVTGATGSGKSTTLAAMLGYKNNTESSHILTIEDPIEFVHQPKHCLINQRELQRDTRDFATALRAALREDPDVILVGELRDLDTMRLALTAAETGHLVLATLHTRSAAQSIHRFVDVFPADEKIAIRRLLADALQAVITQTLLKCATGGRVAAYEVMCSTPAVRNLIREDKVAQLYSAIQTGQAQGMQTLEQSIQSLVQQEKVAAPRRDAATTWALD